MRFQTEHRDALGDRANKDDTEIPIGRPHEPANRGVRTWRCRECGEVGRLVEDLPTACPECTASKEQLYYRQED